MLNHANFPHITLNLFLVSLTYAVINIFYIISLQLMDVTAMGPLFNFRSVFSVLLGVIMLGEKVNLFQIMMIIIILTAGILVNLDEKLKLKSFFSAGILAMMVFLLALAFNGIYTNLAIAENGYWTTTLWSMVIAQLLYFFTVPLFWKDLIKT